VGLVKLPDDVSDDQVILISDIFPTGYFGAKLAEISVVRTRLPVCCVPAAAALHDRAPGVFRRSGDQ
jgi:hypothetical protein